MKRVFLDTSIFIRFFTEDDEKKAKDCIRIFGSIESGKVRPYTSSIVIQEILYVLLKKYRFPKSQVLGDLQKTLALRNLTLVESTNTTTALLLYKKFNVNYGDCLIATQIPKGMVLVSYDKDFDKLKVLRKDPSEILGYLFPK